MCAYVGVPTEPVRQLLSVDHTGTGVGSNDLPTNPSGCFDPARIPQSREWYLTERQQRAQFSLWAVMSSPLLISADVGQVSEFTLQTWGNEEVIAVNQE